MKEITPVCDMENAYRLLLESGGISLDVGEHLERRARRNARWAWRFRKLLIQLHSDHRSVHRWRAKEYNEMFDVKKQLTEANARIKELEERIENMKSSMLSYMKGARSEITTSTNVENDHVFRRCISTNSGKSETEAGE